MNKKIRILHVVGKRPKGGIGTFLINITKYVDKKKFEFDFLINGSKIPGEFDQKMLDMESKVYVLTELKYKDSMKYFKELKTFYNKHHNYDIIHIHSPNIALFNYWAVKKYSNIRIAVHSHSTKYSDKVINSIRNYFLHMPIKKIADIYFACSNTSAEFLYGKKGVFKNKVKIIRNAIETEEFTFDKSIRMKVRNNLGIQNELIIGHVGTFVPVKNHEFIIKIFTEILYFNENAILVLVGDGDLETKIKTFVNELGISDSVIFLGRRQDVSNIMQAFDIFLMPSKFEGVPLVGIEAQAAGLPCFFSNTITRDIKIIDDVYFNSLDDFPKIWANKITEYYANNCEQRNREDFAKCVRNSGFDVKESVKVIEKVYFEHCRK